MKRTDWHELINDCPLTTEEYQAFFSGRKALYWTKNMFNLEIITDFLTAKGIQLEIQKFKKSWLFKIWLDGKLIACQEDLKNKQVALSSGIKEAFCELEY